MSHCELTREEQAAVKTVVRIHLTHPIGHYPHLARVLGFYHPEIDKFRVSAYLAQTAMFRHVPDFPAELAPASQMPFPRAA